MSAGEGQGPSVALARRAWVEGRYEACEQTVDQLLEDDDGLLSAEALVIRAESRADRGQHEQAERDLADAENRVGGDPTCAEAVLAVRVRLASQRDDRAEVEQLAEASRPLGGGEELQRLRLVRLESLARVESRTRAWCQLDRLLLHGGHDLDRLVATAAAHGRFGDASASIDACERILRHPELAPRDRWRVRLLRACALHRSSHDDAPRATAAALREAGRLHPATATAREPQLVARLAGLAHADGLDFADRTVADIARLELRILGDFLLLRAGQPVELPSTAAARLLAFLAVPHPAVASREDAQLLLWPEASAKAAGARLRNVLTSVRRAVGTVVIASGRTLSLAPNVTVDAHEFERMASRALATERDGGSEPKATAVASMLLYCGPVLPNLPYEDWTANYRERLRRLYLRCLDLRARQLAAAGDREGAVERLLEGIRMEPHDLGRYDRAAELMRQLGRSAEADRLADEQRAPASATGARDR